MQTSCCYAVQDKTWVADPDGNEWEAFVVLEDNLPETTPCECGVKTTESQATEVQMMTEAQTTVEAQTSQACCATEALAETTAAETALGKEQFVDCGPS